MPVLPLWPAGGQAVAVLTAGGLVYNFTTRSWDPLGPTGKPTQDQTDPITRPVQVGPLAGNGFWVPPGDFQPPNGGAAICILAADAAGNPKEQVGQCWCEGPDFSAFPRGWQR